MFSCFSPSFFLQKNLGPPRSPAPPDASRPQRVGAGRSDPPNALTPDPDASAAHGHGRRETKEEQRERARGGVAGAWGCGGGRGGVPSISRSSGAPYSRSVIFSRFHLAASAICHLALAQKRSSEPRSVLFHHPPRPSLHSLSVLSSSPHLLRLDLEDREEPYVHIYEEPFSSHLLL